MLKKLTIRNYILIDELDIQFSDNLSIITGETGAGKSILLGALGLILGQRADAGTLLDKKKEVHNRRRICYRELFPAAVFQFT